MGKLLHERNTGTKSNRSTADRPSSWVSWVTPVLLLIALALLAFVTPGGLLKKADLVGYAVCHQIPSHSLGLGGRYLPLCARCTGTFLGALFGLLGQVMVLRRRQASAFPPFGILAILISFTLLWASDGLNSYLALIGAPHVYEPANGLRLITGALNGLTMSALVYPIFNISVWWQPADRPNIRGVRDLAVLLLVEAVLVAVVLSGGGFLLYPLALLSAFAVVILLASVNTVLAVMLLGRENSATTWRQALLPVALGLLLSFLQIGLIDLMRYAATGTLGPIPTLQ